MKNKCVEIGILQGFVDGELRNQDAENVVRHLSLCENCRVALADLESEGELVFSSMDAEYNVLVPTERLRAKVFASISEFESGANQGLLARFMSGFGILTLRPGFATVAGILLFAALFTIGFRYLNSVEPDGTSIAALESAVPGDTEAGNGKIDSLQIPGSESAASPPVDVQDGKASPSLPGQVNAGIAAVRASVEVDRSERKKVTVIPKIERKPAAEPLKSVDLDAEEGFLTTIATLNRTVNENKDYVLRPSERVAYERNLAVVDDAIKKMKGEVRNNPNNTAAREVLRSSYRNKIDLLSSVAARTETVASLY